MGYLNGETWSFDSLVEVEHGMEHWQKHLSSYHTESMSIMVKTSHPFADLRQFILFDLFLTELRLCFYSHRFHPRLHHF